VDGLLIVIRFGLYADLAALAGLPLFWWSMRQGFGAGARLILSLLTLGAAGLSLLWLLASVSAMIGSPLFAPDWNIVAILLRETPIGSLLAVRAAALVLVLLLLLRPRSTEQPPAMIAICASLAAVTLAWSGHAGATEGAAGMVHRAADVLHIIAASAWFGALLALLAMIFGTAWDLHAARRTAHVLHRFSLFGTLFVAALIISGLINGVMIVGVANLSGLPRTPYGQLLLAKLALFGGMLLLAAANRWRLTPALAAAAAGSGLDAVRRHLRFSLVTESAAALAILALVAALGTLDPSG
jgi:Putative copper export protein